MNISQNTALFSLVGTMYGGDGKVTFALPNLQNSAPLQSGQGAGLSSYFLGEQGGIPNVALTQSEMPAHTHLVNANTSGGASNDPSNADWAVAGAARGTKMYTADTAHNTPMSPLAASVAGGGVPHNNMMPYLGLTFTIALQGIFPPRG
jgi:microcystin-dependent protein